MSAVNKPKQPADQLLPLLNSTAATTINKSSLLTSATTSVTIDRGHNDDNNKDLQEDVEMVDNNSDTEALPAKRGMRQRRSTSRHLELLALAVNWIQQWKLPRSWILRKITSSSNSAAGSSTTTITTTSKSNTDASNNKTVGDDATAVPLISGLDRVVFGTASASEAVLLCGMKPPQYLWYMLSGAICDVIQFFIDVALHVTWGIEDASLCWALGFGMSIIFRHTSHRYLVFGDYVGGYAKSLLRMYGGYSIIIVISTMFNIIMTKLAKMNHYAAWIITLLWTGIVNYFILKKIWSFGGGGGGNSKAGGATTTAGAAASRGRTSSSGSINSSGISMSAMTKTPLRGRTSSSGSATAPRERPFSSSTTADSDKKMQTRNERDDTSKHT